MEGEKDENERPTKFELPPSAYRLDGHQYSFPEGLPKRQEANSADQSGYCTVGKKITVRLNQFRVNKWPQKKVYQYDVMIGSGNEKRGLIMKAWKSKAVQSKLGQVAPCWLFDWNKIAWCSASAGRGEVKIMVDFDAENNVTPRPGRENKVRVVIRQSKEIPMAVISGYLEQKMEFDNSVLEAITFLDHMMRQWPKDQYVDIKRSFYARTSDNEAAIRDGPPRSPLDDCIEAMKGVYTSMRLNNPTPSIGGLNTSGLAVNVDVANGVFWVAQNLAQAARNFCKTRNKRLDYRVFSDLCMPVKHGNGVTMSVDFKELRKMSRLQFSVKHRGKAGEYKYKIKRFVWDEKKYGAEGANAKNVTFELKDPKNREAKGKEISLFDYFQKAYNIRLDHWYLPVVETEKFGLFPMEVCHIVPQQQYKFKLSPDQTAKMIKFAVTRPKERLSAIQNGIQMLKWAEDPYLRHYGVEIDTKLTESHARLLAPPEVQYSMAKCNPGTTGRWDLRGKKFLLANPKPLVSWGVVVLDGCVGLPVIQNFIKVFIQTYVGHGGKVDNRTPIIQNAPRGSDLGAVVANLRTAVSNANKGQEPQILMFVLPEKNSITYERLKKNMDCRFGIVSQMMNMVHVQKAQPQYCSNVCMKFNAKLGGTTCRVAGKNNTTSYPFFNKPTMILGSDVSHPAPNSPQGSMAAITMSMDKDCLRYAAAVQTNGRRVEMITKGNFRSMVMPLFRHWVSTVGGGKGPAHIYYFRDGVSEGQYLHVLEQEVVDLKDAIADKYGKGVLTGIKFTVIVCSKRHHLRIFPKDGDFAAGDKNGNPLPGTLVERDVTHPFEHDFYLNSHTAIQGTARPVHYHVLLDEEKVSLNGLYQMIYTASYQYARATTPVSLFPAVYYAHLASNRARAHENVGSDQAPRGGQKQQEAFAKMRATGKRTETSDPFNNATEVQPLVALGSFATPENKMLINTGMWYI